MYNSCISLILLITALVEFCEPTNIKDKANAENSTIIDGEDSRCSVDSACNRLIEMGLCVERMKKKMEEKCPRMCVECGSGYPKPKKYELPKIIKDNLELMDAEMNETLFKVASAYREDTLKNSMVMDQIQLESSTIFKETKISFDGTSSRAELQTASRQKRKLTANVLAAENEHFKKGKERDRSSMKNLVTKINDKNTAENEAWREDEYEQLREDQEKWINIETAANAAKAAASSLSSIPFVGGTLHSAAVYAIDEATRIYEINNPRKTEDEIYYKAIEKKTDQLTDMTMKIAIKTEEKLNEIQDDIAALYKVTMKGIELIRGDLEKSMQTMKILAAEISSKIETSHRERSRDSYITNYRLKLNQLMSKYEDYMNSGMSMKRALALKEVCSTVSIDALIQTLSSNYNEDKLKTARLVTGGKISLLRADFNELFNDLQLYNMLMPVCVQLQNYSTEVSCKKLFTTAKTVAVLQNNMLAILQDYFNDWAILKAINDKMDNLLNGVGEIKNAKNAVDIVTQKLADEFPDLSFFVYGELKQNGLEHDISDDSSKFFKVFKLKNITFTIFWHSKSDELDGVLWEKCYNGSKDDTQKWYVNRPRCVRVGLNVPKTVKECISPICKIENKETIPGCITEEKSGKRSPCFDSQQPDEFKDPVQYLSGIVGAKPEVVESRRTFSGLPKQQLLKPSMTAKIIRGELRKLPLTYCLQAVLHIPSTGEFSTTMTGVGLLENYYIDAFEKIVSKTFKNAEIFAIFKKCPQKNIMRKVPDKTFENRCIKRIQDNLDLNAAYIKQMNRFVKKVEVKEEKIEKDEKKKKSKKLAIILVSVFGVIGALVVALVVVGVVIRKRKSRSMATNAKQSADPLKQKRLSRQKPSEIEKGQGSRRSTSQIKKLDSSRRSSKLPSKSFSKKVVKDKTSKESIGKVPAKPTSKQNLKRSSSKVSASKEDSKLQRKESKGSRASGRK